MMENKSEQQLLIILSCMTQVTVARLHIQHSAAIDLFLLPWGSI